MNDNNIFTIACMLIYRLPPCIIRTPLLQLKSVEKKVVIYVSVYNPHPDFMQMSFHTN